MRTYLLAFAALLACAPAAAAPLEAFGQLPTILDIDLSPDGTKVAYIQEDAGRGGVVAISLDTSKLLFAAKYPDVKLRGITWGDEGHLLVTRSSARQAVGVIGPNTEWTMLDNIDLATGKAHPLLKDVPNGMNVIMGSPVRRTVKNHGVVFVEGLSFVEHMGTATLYKIDLASSSSELVPRVAMGVGQRLLDKDGAPLAEAAYNETAHHWNLWIYQGGSRRLALQVPAMIDRPSIAGVTADGSALIVHMLDADRLVYRPLPLSGGDLGAPIAAYERYVSLMTDPLTHRVFGGVVYGTTTQYSFFDPKEQAAWSAVLAHFPDEEVKIAAWSQDRSKVVVEITGQVHGDAYVLIDTKTGKAVQIGDVYAGLKPADISGVEAIEYKAADGKVIPAYLTLPNGKDPKALPLIVLPHGGPATMDAAGFDWWAQALASRGYAVLQPQYRGSYGFGWSFYTAGFGEWGRKMQTDLSDGVRALAHVGIVDPKRVCIVGGSYGGYAALAGAAMDTGVYRCAVSVSGISDMRKMMAWQQDRAGGAFNPTMRNLDRFTGAKDTHDPVLDQISPIRHLDRVNIPILLIHGKDDTVVPIEQSKMMADALTAAGRQVQFTQLQGEDHWMSRSETRLQMLQTSVKFLEANNPPN